MTPPHTLNEIETLQQAAYYMLADRLEVTLATRNLDAAVTCMKLSTKMYKCGIIDLVQYADLREGFCVAYPHVHL